MTHINFKEDLSTESCNPMSSEELAPSPKLYQEYLRRWYFQEQYTRHNVENNPCPSPTTSSSSPSSLSSLFPYGDDVLIVPTKTPVATATKSMPSVKRVHYRTYPDYTSRAVVTPKAA